MSLGQPILAQPVTTCKDAYHWELSTKNKDLEAQLEKSIMFGGPQVNKPISKEEELGTVPHSLVEFSEVEENQIAQVEEEKEQEPSLDIDVETKSWWRRQAAKVVKGMGTFCLRFNRCQGVKSSQNIVTRLFNI